VAFENDHRTYYSDLSPTHCYQGQSGFSRSKMEFLRIVIQPFPGRGVRVSLRTGDMKYCGQIITGQWAEKRKPVRSLPSGNTECERIRRDKSRQKEIFWRTWDLR
jgi:hypothetical protein